MCIRDRTKGTGGNLSVYIPSEEKMLITPSGIDFFDIKVEDIVTMKLDGTILEGDKKPSSEWYMHAIQYKNRDDITAVIHAHTTYSTVVATLRETLPPAHYLSLIHIFIEDLDKYFKEKHNLAIENKNDYFKIIYQSIVANYKEVVKNIESCLGKKFTRIHVMGGGSQSKVLCQMIADKLNIKVIAGPKEATAIGNILAQLEYKNEKENIRKIVTDGFETITYLPNKNN